MLLEQQRLAQDQQVGLDATESNLQAAGDSLDTGVEELTQARNLRRGCCGMILESLNFFSLGLDSCFYV
jgi:hypothetical protein